MDVKAMDREQRNRFLAVASVEQSEAYPAFMLMAPWAPAFRCQRTHLTDFTLDDGQLKSFRVRFDPAWEDAVATALWELNVSGTQELTSRPGEVTWAVFAEDPSVDANALQYGLGRWLLGPVELHDSAQTDWVAEYRKHFRPFTVGSFRIVPEWAIEPRGERTLVMDPGRAFGTGTHESTRLCLLALEGLSAAGRSLGRLVDIGTGTGILSLAALQLGARSVLGTDNDPEALRNAAAHARLNGRSLPLVCGDAAAPLRPASFDGAVANIAAPLLQSRAEQIEDVVCPGGFLLLSGLLTNEAETVAAAYRRSADRGRLSEGEWSCVILERLP